MNEKLKANILPALWAIGVCTLQHFGISLAAAADLLGAIVGK